MGTCTFEDESMQQASAKDYWCSLSALFKHSVINFVQKKFSLYLELFGGHQFESSKYFTYRKTLRTFRGAPVKKRHPVCNLILRTFRGVPVKKDNLYILCVNEAKRWKIETLRDK